MLLVLTLLSLCAALADDTLASLAPPPLSPVLPYALRRTALIYGAAVRVAAGVPREEAEIPVSTASSLTYLMGHLASLRERFVAEELRAPSVVSRPCPTPPSPTNTTQWMLCVLDRGSQALVSAGVSNAAALIWKELPPSHKLTSVFSLRLALTFASVHPWDTKDARSKLLGKGGLIPTTEGVNGGSTPPPIPSPEDGAGSVGADGSSDVVGGGGMSSSSSGSSAPPPPPPPPPYLPGSPPHALAPLPDNSYPEYPEIPRGVDFALAVAGLVAGIPLEALELDLGTRDTITPVAAALDGDAAALVRARLTASVAEESEKWAGLHGWDHRPPPPYVLNATALALAKEERVLSREKLLKLGVAIAPSLPTAEALAGVPDGVFARQEAVRRAFQHDWKAYTTLAWGKDVYRPLSRTHTTDLCQLGETLVDSLDTLLIMGLVDEYVAAREWVLKSLPGDVGGQGDINLFECSIRIVGGLLGAYDLSGDPVFLIRGESVARAMVEAGAFASPTGMPYSTLFLEHREWSEMDGVKTMGGCLTRLPFQCATTTTTTTVTTTKSDTPTPTPTPISNDAGGDTTPAGEEGEAGAAAAAAASEAEDVEDEALECNTPGLELPRAVPGNAAVGIRTVCGHAYNPTQTAGCSSSSEVATLQVEMSTLTGAYMELGLDVITAAGLVNAAMKDLGRVGETTGGGGGGGGDKVIGAVVESSATAGVPDASSHDTPAPPAPSQEEASPQSLPSPPSSDPSSPPLPPTPSPSSTPAPPPPLMPPQSPVFMRAMALLTQLGGLQLPNPPVGTFSYHSLGRTAQSALLKADPPGGLYPIFVHPQTGTFLKDAPVSLGARGDSLYEYLLKEWLVLGGWRSERRRASALATLAVLALSPSFSWDESSAVCSSGGEEAAVEGVEDSSSGGGGSGASAASAAAAAEESVTPSTPTPPPTPLPLIFTEKEVEVMVDTEVQGVITTALEVDVEVDVEVPSVELRGVDVDVDVDMEVMVMVEVGVVMEVAEMSVNEGGVGEGGEEGSVLLSTPTTTTSTSFSSSLSPTVSRTTSLSATVTAMSTSTMSRTVSSSQSFTTSFTTTMTSSLTSTTTIVAESLGGVSPSPSVSPPTPTPTPTPSTPTPTPIIPPQLLASSLKAITHSREDDPRDLLRSYNKAVAGIMDRLLQVSTPSHYLYVAEQQKGAADVGEGKEPLLIHKMDHLVCFLPGMLALGSVHGAGHEALAVAREKSIRGNAVADALKTHFPQLFHAADGGGGGGGDTPPHSAPSSSVWPWDSEYEEDVEYRNPPPPSSPHHFNNVVEEGGREAAEMDYLYTFTPHPLRCNGTCTSPPSPTLATAYSRALELVERWNAGGEVLLLQDLNAIGRWGVRGGKRGVGSGVGGGCGPLPTWPPFSRQVEGGVGSSPGKESEAGASTPTSDSSPDAPTTPSPSSLTPTTPTEDDGSKKEGGGGEEATPTTLAGRILAAANRLARAAVPVLAGGGAKSAPKSTIAPTPDPIIDPFAYLSHPGHIRATLLSTAAELTRTCVALYTTTTTGLAPEIVTFQSGGDFTPNSDARHSFLRPETVESLFVLRALGLSEGVGEVVGEEGVGEGEAVDEPNEQGSGAYWDIFNAMERHARVRYGGHATVKDVGLGPFSSAGEGGEAGQGGGGGVSSAGVENMRDRMDSFVLAETYKYLYLLASPHLNEEEGGGGKGVLQGLSSLKGWVLNTEAHPVRVRDSGPSTWRLAFEGVTKKQQQQQQK